MLRVSSQALPERWPNSLTTALWVLRLVIGWHFFYEGLSKLLATGWSSANYLSTAEWIFGGLFQGIASTPWLVRTVDILNAWGLAAIGLCLMLGAFTRTASLAGAGLLVLYSLAHPALPGMTGSTLGGSYLIVDRNLVEALALVAIAVLPQRVLWGLDRLLHQRRSAASSKDEVSSEGSAAAAPVGRRELMKDLAGIPVLGAMAAAVVGSRVIGEKAAQVDAISGATRLATSAPAAIGGTRGNVVSIRDFERLAPKYMTPTNYSYVSGGAGDEQTLYWNEAAFRQIRLRQRVYTVRESPDTRLRLLDHDLAHPILIAPAGGQMYLHPEGELATARGAGAAGAIMIVSTVALQPIEDIAKAATQPLWYQAYLYRERERSKDNLHRVEAAGYKAVCVTVDSSSNGPRDREYRAKTFPDPEARFMKHREDQWTWLTTWDDIDWYRANTRLPVIPKGIMTADDAELSIQHGAAAVYISNHGARNLDSGIAPIQVLPAIAERVAGRVPIIVDGGIRRGGDILKALALGATAVAIGRPYLYGLSVMGAEGVAAVVNMLRNEFEMSLISTGQTSLRSLDRATILSMDNFPGDVA